VNGSIEEVVNLTIMNSKEQVFDDAFNEILNIHKGLGLEYTNGQVYINSKYKIVEDSDSETPEDIMFEIVKGVDDERVADGIDEHDILDYIQCILLCPTVCAELDTLNIKEYVESIKNGDDTLTYKAFKEFEIYLEQTGCK
jgi:hypothetical protein